MSDSTDALGHVARSELLAGEEPDTSDAAVVARLLTERFSCRAFKSEPVPRHIIEQMLTMAQMAPSWCNSQPWNVIVTEGSSTEDFRQVLYARAEADMLSAGMQVPEPDVPFPSGYKGVYKARQREVGWQLYRSLGIANGDRAASAKAALDNFRLFGAPHALILTSERDLGAYGAVDCGVYIGALTLAAQSLGIGMIPQAALAMYAPTIRQHFDVAENRLIILGASFGYPDLDHPANAFRSLRAPLSHIVQWDKD